MPSRDRRSDLVPSRTEPFQPLSNLSDEELLVRCRELCIHVSLPFSLIEAEAVHRNVSVEALLRDYLTWKIEEASEA